MSITSEIIEAMRAAWGDNNPAIENDLLMYAITGGWFKITLATEGDVVMQANTLYAVLYDGAEARRIPTKRHPELIVAAQDCYKAYAEQRLSVPRSVAPCLDCRMSVYGGAAQEDYSELD